MNNDIDHFVINIYEYTGDGIKINQIKAVDKKGKYIKFVKLKEVMPYLSKYNVKFRDYEEV